MGIIDIALAIFIGGAGIGIMALIIAFAYMLIKIFKETE